MKSEDIFNGVTNIRDDIIDDAAKKRKGAQIWRAAVAAVLAVAVAAGGFALWPGRIPAAAGGLSGAASGEPSGGEPAGGAPGMPSVGGGPGAPSGTPVVRTLARAVYPERPQYPADNGESIDEWMADARERRLTDEEREAMTPWNTAAISALLTGRGDGNTVCSPTGLYLAFAMLAETAGGENREQILKALGIDSVEELRATVRRLWNALYNDDGTYSLTLANSVWLRDGAEYNEEPLDILARDYYASAFSGRMGSEEINAALHDWLNKNTGGLLQEQAEGVSFDDDTVLALASAVYFRDKWYSGFSESQTAPGTFHAPGGDVERDFMNKTYQGTYYRGGSFTAIELAFEMGGTMRLILPDEGVNARELLSESAALAILSGGEYSDDAGLADITLSLPRFDVSFDGDLKEAIAAMGITLAFDPNGADFSPIVGDLPLFVSQVCHAARVKVDEEGCEAAAYTVLLTNSTSAQPEDYPDVEIVFDRPFLFSIVNSSQPIFTGIVSEP